MPCFMHPPGKVKSSPSELPCGAARVQEKDTGVPRSIPWVGPNKCQGVGVQAFLFLLFLFSVSAAVTAFPCSSARYCRNKWCCCFWFPAVGHAKFLGKGAGKAGSG